jgi:hypothetical protein
MMFLNRFKVARFSLLALFGIVTVLQLFSFPGQFAYMRRANGLSLLIEILLTLVVALLFACAQIAIISLWKIINHIEQGRFHSRTSYLWMNRLVLSLKTASLFPILLILIVAPKADDPGVLVLLIAITLFVSTLFQISSIFRDQIQSKEVN